MSTETKYEWNKMSYKFITDEEFEKECEEGKYEPTKNLFGDMRICPVCGKNFLPAVLNIYKVNISSAKYQKGQHLCSYTCYNKANDYGKKRKTKFKKLEIE